MEQVTTEGAAAPKRPTFLTVLCILSFVGCAWGLISGISTYFTAKSQIAATLTKDVGTVQGVDAKAVEATTNNIIQAMGIDPVKLSNGNLMIALLNVVILLGALMMWMLKKIGFYIYTVGQLAVLGVMFGYIGGLVGGLGGIVAAILSAAFIIMYAVNLKAMK
jgi:hypothetical protein